MDEFVLWMNSLDASVVAAKESFHSQNHRDWMKIHEFEKSRLATKASRVEAHERKLSELARSWATKDARIETTKSRVSQSEFIFTEKQIEIAMKAGVQ